MRFAWLVKEALSLLLGLSLISCEFDYESEADGIAYGYLPQVSNLSERSIAFSIYPHSLGYVDELRMVTGVFSDPAGFYVSVGDDDEIVYYQKGETGPGMWQTPSDSITVNDWFHVIVTRDSSDPGNQPIIYLDGVSQTLRNPSEQNGATADETGSGFFIGNTKTATVDWIWAFDGLIKDVRIYNVILTQAEATALAAEEEVTRGLVFQGSCVRTRELSDFEDKTLLSTDRMIDNIYGMVGAPHGSVITRLIP